jgi:hypothetical protein
MARFVLILLFVIAGALVIALYFDHRGRRDERIDRLRWTFLHGTPLAGYSRAAALSEFVHPGGMRFRAPASWTVETAQRGHRSPSGAPGAGRLVGVELVRLEGQGTAGTESVVAALKSLHVEGERSVETLANGNALMKTVESVRDQKALFAVYAWRIGHALPSGGMQIAAFRLRVPVETAADVIVQSDLAILDREIRDATFSEGAPAATPAT